jgi:hypothetical protein
LNEEYSLGMVSREGNVRLDGVALETRLDANEQSTFVFSGAALHHSEAFGGLQSKWILIQ